LAAKEIEVKYIISARVLSDQIELRALPKFDMTQAYYSPERIQGLLLPLLRERVAAEDCPLDLDYQNGRVRKTTENGTDHYSLTVKGPRENHYSRVELEIEIECSEYERLLPQADEGSVSKTRHHVAGDLTDNSGQEYHLHADLDLLHSAAGAPIFTDGLPPFVIVEVEVPDEALIPVLQSGEHSFAFLKQALEIADLPHTAQRVLRMRYLAKYGADDRVRGAVCDFFRSIG
jgi:CYTH domain-containing protein